MTMAKNDLKQMLALQKANNDIVSKNWVASGWPFLRAVVVEGAEGMEHVGWKWWKAQSMDKSQAQLELVDIWHFYLSAVLVQQGGDIEGSAEWLSKEVNLLTKHVKFDDAMYQLDAMDVVSKFELIIGLAVSRRVHVGLFLSLMGSLDMGVSELMKTYVGKNVLNQFRQANGYKQGTYLKVWSGLEDNVHLASFLENDFEGKDIAKEIWAHLDDMYKKEKTS
jgi:dimeric dUTPase (all-alpha-NTP-PPase superfamily)